MHLPAQGKRLCWKPNSRVQSYVWVGVPGRTCELQQSTYLPEASVSASVKCGQRHYFLHQEPDEKYLAILCQEESPLKSPGVINSLESIF